MSCSDPSLVAMGDFGMVNPQTKLVFVKNSIPRLDGGLYAGQTELLQRKVGVNYQ